MPPCPVLVLHFLQSIVNNSSDNFVKLKKRHLHGSMGMPFLYFLNFSFLLLTRLRTKKEQKHKKKKKVMKVPDMW